MSPSAIFILTNGRIGAIDKSTGNVIWQVKLKTVIGKNYLNGIGQIKTEGDKIIIGVSGYVCCLHAHDGSLVWKNELKGWGYNLSV